ncbi:MAG: hypothetical protein ACRDJT_11700 [Actinomycetota bacterium]
MSRPKLQSLTMATVRCLLGLCVFGLLFGYEIAAMRATKRSSKTPATMQTAAKGLQSFAIEGEIEGLYPGARVPLNIRVTNPLDNPLRVRSVEVEVQDSDLSGCGREWVESGRNVTISTLVPPQSTAFLAYPVWMADGAPAACQGATWALGFTGVGAVPGEQGPSDAGTGESPGANAPGDENGGAAVLPFTGSGLVMILGVALTAILSGLAFVVFHRSGNET